MKKNKKQIENVEASDTINATNAPKVEEEPEYTMAERKLSGVTRYLFGTIAVIGVLFHLYILNFNPIDPWIFRSTHLAFGAILAFMLYPGWRTKSNKVSVIDWILIAATIYIAFYIYTNLNQVLFRFGVAPTEMDFYVALGGLLIVFELARRTSGWMLPALAGIFVLYAFIGPWLPGIFHHQGYSVQRFVTYIYGLDGIFGVTLDVSSKYIVLFIVFGAFLQMSKVGNYFMDIALATAGGLRGGPAKVAVFSSALMGMMNGTSAGNAVATGSLTIPLMKKVGYKARFAAATEATASAGGQILPPIMGAGAFIMAEILGIPYSQIILAAIIPALLYFISVYFMVDFEALKQGMKGLPRNQLPKLKDIAKKLYLIIPIVVLIYMLVSGYSIIRSGTIGIIACLVISWIHPSTRMGIKKILLALELGMKSALQLISVVACAGIIVGVIALTGVGMQFSSMLLSIADNNLLLALIFAMLLSIILGMGMPTTAAYAVAASVVAPGLIRIGIDPLLAHMFVFYYAVISAITPPVALAAFAAAGIAGTNPMKTGVQAFKLGIAAFIVPFMFFYSPQLLLMSDSWIEITFVALTAVVGVYLLAASVQGWFFKTTTNIFTSIMLFVAAILLMLSNVMLNVIALLIVTGVIFLQINKKKHKVGATNLSQ
ncbi:TRAP transporter permease [Halalkalibacter nanhaiisediminis]|uniref:TRAP transporter 4TM/12TM fusion protein n=1 Tax=Halalkalibacter nanhaiisediminis TaxID=688079 RepID=A0A562QMX4_9BACI|nr:TRAP transporter permease [Halalkalibacter nanhaiisediminis]TWI58111.1 TRAP transporter 4TM/12TM fusion protein [Halalkalibacter nanhaiisediminis]